MNEIFIRRSIRRWQDRPIEKEKIESLLRAAMQAPSARNSRPWEFVVATSKPLLKAFSEICTSTAHCAYAPAVITIIGKTYEEDGRSFWHQGCAAAAQNILLQSVSLGLGGIWVSISPHLERVESCRRILRLPGGKEAFGLIALGYPAEGQGHHFIDRYEADRVHWEGY